DEIDFENESASGSYSWDFGPNADPPISTAVNPQNIVFSQSGLQDITLSVNASGCSNTITKTVFVEDADATFSLSPDYSCSEPLVVTFTPNLTTATQYLWNFGDGNTSLEQNPTHEYNNDENTYSVNGTMIFPVQLTVITTAGCMNTFIDTVILNEPNALFMPDVINGCAPLTVEFSDSSWTVEPMVLYEYDYGDGNTASFTNDDPHTHTFTDPGEYPVQLIVTNEAGCTDTSYQLIIEVGDDIAPSFTVDQTEICPGDSILFTNTTPIDNIDAYHYTTDDNRSFHCFGDPDMTHIFQTEPGVYDVTLTVEYNGCYSSFTETDMITVNGPIAKIDYLFDCENPLDVAFTDASLDATNVTWDFGDMTTSTMTDLVHTYDSTDVYTVVLTAENNASGCPASTDTVDVHVTQIQAAITLDTLLCTSIEYQLDASESIDVEGSCWRGYTWYPSYNRPITTEEDSIPQFFPEGDQSLMLVVTDINGCKDTTNHEFRVFDATPDFSFDDDKICLPADVQFTDLSTADTTIVEWQWDFGDMNTSEDQNTTHTYSSGAVGTVQVSLQITDAIGCPFTATDEIEIYEPISFISTVPFPANLCVGDSIDFSATDFTQEGSSLIFDWDLDNGTTGSNNTITTAYETGGTYNVVLNYEEIATGCENTSTTTVTVQDFPEAAFTSDMDGMGIICYPQNALFMDASNTTSPLSYQWDFGNGQMASAMDPGASFGKGVFEVTLITSTAFGCADTVMQTYSLIGPEGDFILDPNSICLGETVNFTLIDTVDISSFSWDFGDGTVVDDINPTSHQYNFNPPSGQTVATLILRAANDACTIPIEKTISIEEVIADFTINDGTDTTACIGEQIVFTNNSVGGDTNNWSFGDGSTSTEESPNNTFTEAGEYQVTLVVASTTGCVDDLTQNVVVFDVPNTMGTAVAVCAGNETILTVDNPTAGNTYTWLPEVQILGDNVGTSVVTAELTSTTIFTLQESNGTGCDNSVAVTADVVPIFTGFLGGDTTICDNTDIVLVGADNEYYTNTWTPADNLSCTDCPVTVATNIVPPQSYTLSINDIFGLGCTPGNFTYNLNQFAGSTALPNAFTPDGDGQNDHFNVITTEDLRVEDVVESFRVWSRWGQLVYDNDTPATGWDGTHKGKASPMDSYIYKIEINVNGCGTFVEEGSLTLIR
ncbi:MAG: PKD domain-containing protein, partial [Saprospiraceae bacterium]